VKPERPLLVAREPIKVTVKQFFHYRPLDAPVPPDPNERQLTACTKIHDMLSGGTKQPSDVTGGQQIPSGIRHVTPHVVKSAS
jgi:hypothetical protein